MADAPPQQQPEKKKTFWQKHKAWIIALIVIVVIAVAAVMYSKMKGSAESAGSPLESAPSVAESVGEGMSTQSAHLRYYYF
jgi:hypothetical protein